MADVKEKVPTRKLKVKNMSPKGQRFVNDALGNPHLLGPGQTLEIEMGEPEAKRFEEMSKNGTGQGLVIEGHEPAPKEAAKIPEEQKNRAALAAKEAELMQAGQEADAKRREEDAKKSGVDRAAETGIHMFARNQEPEVVALPPDAPEPEAKPKTGSGSHAEHGKK